MTFQFDQKTVNDLGLYQSYKPVNAHVAQDSKIFQFRNLEDIYVMESDLYGNTMPAGSCFLAFNGRHGMLGKHLLIDALRRSSLEEIKKMVADNSNG